MLKDLELWVTVIVGLGTLLTLLIGFWRYLGFRSRAEKMTIIGKAFQDVVDLVASDKEVNQFAGAVLLRRFFDSKTEMGEGRVPYATETVNVIAALLRTIETGNLQKLLADGLRHAPNLHHVDLQGTNLTEAYWGEWGNRTVDLQEADLFRANLEGASLSSANAAGAIFYEANLTRCVFSGAILKGADLRGANLQNAKFDKADLSDVLIDERTNLVGASFAEARNVPDSLAERIC